MKINIRFIPDINRYQYVNYDLDITFTFQTWVDSVDRVDLFIGRDLVGSIGSAHFHLAMESFYVL